MLGSFSSDPSGGPVGQCPSFIGITPTARIGLPAGSHQLPRHPAALRDRARARTDRARHSGQGASPLNLPEELRRSLTWDQGAEMAQHDRLKIDAGVHVYFCDPQSPWQRGTNENTNGLLRQYFPKGTDLSVHSADEITAVAAALNARPRKTLGWKTPAEALDEWLP